MKKIILLGVVFLFICSCSKKDEIPQISDQVPAITMQDLQGQSVNLKPSPPQTELIVYWATWCPGCLAEIPNLNMLSQKYNSKLRVLGLSVDENPEILPDAVQKLGIQYPILIANDLSKAAFGGVEGLPKLVLVSKTGQVIRQWVGAPLLNDLEKEIQADIQ